MHTKEHRRPDRAAPVRRRRRVWTGLAAVVGVLGVLAAGCGDPEPNAAAPAVSGSDSKSGDVIKPAEGAPKAGGTLRVGLDAETEGWDPTESRWAAAGITVARSVFDPLVSIDKDMKWKPFLAESLTPSDNYQTWDIKLRPGIKFHDGTALDSAALHKFLDEYKKSIRVGSVFAPVQTIEVADPLTVRLKMSMPWAAFPIVLAVQPGLVAAPSQLDSPDGKQHPVGTGPYKFVSWAPEKNLIVEKNPDYWRKDVIHLDKIDFRPIADDQTRYKSFKAGDIDVMISPREQSIQNLAADGQAGTAQVVRAKGDNDVNMLMLNTSKAPFNDPKLREAVARAIDRSQLVALTNSGPELAADNVYAKDSKWYVPNDFPQYDPEKAKALVSQIAGEGGRIALTLATVPDQDLARTIQLVQQQLMQVGIDVKLDTTEQATLINKAISGDYQFMTWRQFGTSDPDGNYVWWSSENADSVPALNMARNKDPQIDTALRAARATEDETARKGYYATVQKRLAADLPYIFTTHLRWTMATSNNVRGLEGGTFPDGTKGAGLISGVMPLNQMWIAS
jgi:peptide/nickel transport system substrate-binding protein